MPRARASATPAPPDASAVLERLLRHYPEPDTELVHRNAFELLVATVLSAQSTDRAVNETTPALFARYPDAAALAGANAADVEPMIHATGFFRVKTKSIVALAQRLVRDHGGRVPADMDVLTTLPGVGRKTANVVLGHALGVPGLPVDRHVLRVAERIGLTRETTPDAVERDLCAALPSQHWTTLSDALILHGRRICRPKPFCPQCEVRDICRYPFKTGETAASGALDLHAPPVGAPVGRARRPVRGSLVEGGACRKQSPAPGKSGAYTLTRERGARTPNAARRTQTRAASPTADGRPPKAGSGKPR